MSTLWWAAPMLLAGGLFAGGVGFIAWERGPAWRASDLPAFRTTFARTLRRADRLQPALVTIWLVSTLGYAATTSGAPRTLALLAAAALLTILVGSIVWLVPIQNRVTAPGNEGLPGELERARSRWLRGQWPSSAGRSAKVRALAELLEPAARMFGVRTVGQTHRLALIEGHRPGGARHPEDA